MCCTYTSEWIASAVVVLSQTAPTHKLHFECWVPQLWLHVVSKGQNNTRILSKCQHMENKIWAGHPCNTKKKKALTWKEEMKVNSQLTDIRSRAGQAEARRAVASKKKQMFSVRERMVESMPFCPHVWKIPHLFLSSKGLTITATKTIRNICMLNTDVNLCNKAAMFTPDDQKNINTWKAWSVFFSNWWSEKHFFQVH